MFTAALFTKAKKWKKLKCSSTDEWIKKMWYTHTNEYYSGIGRNEVLIHATAQTNLENVLLSKISQTQKDINCVIPLM